jgi:hypothetical protein
MVWTWRFETAEGTEVQPAVQPEEFPTQGDAESWLGLNWKELLEGGADQVVLSDGDTKIYGPMSLHADSDSGSDTGADSESDSGPGPEPAAEPAPDA